MQSIGRFYALFRGILRRQSLSWLKPSVCLLVLASCAATKSRGGFERAAVDLDASGLGLNCSVYAFVKLSSLGSEQMSAFERLVSGMVEVVSCERVTGVIDYLIKVVATDIQGYDHFLRRKLLKELLISDVESHIVVAHTEVDRPCR